MQCPGCTPDRLNQKQASVLLKLPRGSHRSQCVAKVETHGFGPVFLFQSEAMGSVRVTQSGSRSRTPDPNYH